MCKVKFQRCRGIRLESKPVSYSWFPTQVGPEVSNPEHSTGLTYLPTWLRVESTHSYRSPCPKPVFFTHFPELETVSI
jgi:hypothetical protein